jgi:hypothetical protein
MHVRQARSSLTNGFPAFYGRRRLSLINQWMAWRGVGYTQHQHSRLPEPRVVARSRNIVTAPRPPPLHIAAIAHRCCCCSSPAPVLEDRSLPLVRPATLILPLDSAWRKQACRASVTTSSTAQPSPPPPPKLQHRPPSLTPIARHSLACNTRSIDSDSPPHRHARRSCTSRRRPETTNDRQEQARAPQGHSLHPQSGIGCPSTRHIAHHT